MYVCMHLCMYVYIYIYIYIYRCRRLAAPATAARSGSRPRESMVGVNMVLA